MPTSRGITRLADIPDGERRDGGPELVIRGEHPVIPVPVLPRRRHEVSETVEELKWGKLDDAAGARPCGLPPCPKEAGYASRLLEPSIRVGLDADEWHFLPGVGTP
jgi:hypothetical protein